MLVVGRHRPSRMTQVWRGPSPRASGISPAARVRRIDLIPRSNGSFLILVKLPFPASEASALLCNLRDDAGEDEKYRAERVYQLWARSLISLFV